MLTVRSGAEGEVRDLLSDLAGVTCAVGFREPEGQLSCVAGIGAALWDRMYDRPRTERKIVHDNLPFGRVGAGEYGTYYIGYAAGPSVIESMLKTCSSAIHPPTTDCSDFSAAVTGGLFFVPTADFLDDPS